MKRIISMLISCILVVFLVACGLNKDQKISSYKDDIQVKLNKMSLEEKIDQMIMLSIDEVIKDGNKVKFTEMNEATQNFISKHQLAGIILFKFNMVDKTQTEKLTKDIQSLSKENKFFIATDQEGGKVDKIPTENKTKSAREIGNTKDSNNAYKAAEIIGSDLKSLGLNLDFAPVMDVDTNPNNPVIGDRAFSNDPKIVGEFGVKFIEGLHSQGILATAKHFPGHGDTTGDSHKELVKVNQPLQRIENVELYPFRKAIENNVDMIMVGHIVVPALDDNKTPASLSKKMMTSLLKEKMGFKGVVITDAFDMKAITQNYDIKSAVMKAINAGADIILMPVSLVPGQNDKEYEELVGYIKEKVQLGEIPEDRINDAITRILNAKKSL
jgi:Beta-glucosidase-related glycosidases